MFLAIANTENKEKKNLEEIRNDTSEKTALIRPSVMLLGYLTDLQKNGLRLDTKFYKDYDHMSVFQPALNDGLKFLSINQ